MAKFLKIHDEFDRDVIVNLEHIVSIEPEYDYVNLSDGNTISIPRQNEWNKVMKFVNENEEV